MADDEDRSSRSVRVPKWNGKRDIYALWLARFKAFARMEKFSAAIKKLKEADLPSTYDGIFAED